MIKVLNVISDTNIGGAGRVLENYLTYADRATYETHIALPKNSDLAPLLRHLGGVVHELQGMRDRSYHKEDVAELMTLMKEIKPDLIHTHGALSGRLAGKRLKIPVVFTRHSAFPVSAKLRYPPLKWVNGWLNCTLAQGIIAVSPAAAQNLIEGGVPKNRITVMMNGVAPVAKKSEQWISQKKAELGLAPDQIVLGILARLEHYKGYQQIIDAATLLKKEGKQFCILIGGEGSMYDHLQTEIKTRQLEREVKLLGFCTDVSEVLSLLDIQLNASYGTETSSLSILEGMSMGLPSIVSDYGGNPCLIADNGLIFQQKNAVALAECIKQLMDNPTMREEMGQAGRNKYKAEFTGEIFAQNIQAVYQKTLRGDQHGTKEKI